jgi:hypothetical protein
VNARLGDRLSTADLQRGVFVGSVPHSRGHEVVTRGEIECAKHRNVMNPLLTKELDEPAARAAHRPF